MKDWKLLLGALALFAVAQTAVAGDPAGCAQTAASGFAGLTSPGHGGSMEGRYSAAALSNTACFGGKDISEWIAGPGMVVTSSMIEEGTATNMSFGVFSTREVDLPAGADQAAGRSELVLVRVINYQLARQVLLTQQLTNDPREALFDFTVAAISKGNDLVYFEVPAWPTSAALHAIRLEGKDQRFVAAGNLDFIYEPTPEPNPMGYTPHPEWANFPLVAATRIDPARGRVTVVRLVSPAGKVICDVDTTDPGYRANPTCKGESAPVSVAQASQTSVAPQRTGEVMFKEMQDAAQLAVTTINVSGAFGLIKKIDACYNTPKPRNDQNFKCIYLDIAGRYIDQSVSAAFNVSPKPFYSYDQVSSRIIPVLSRQQMDTDTANSYLRDVTKVIEALVEKDMASDKAKDR